MYTAQPKNMLVMNILEILKKHSDAELRLLIDSLLFSKHLSYGQCIEDEVTINVVVNLQAMRYWAMQYARFVEVLKSTKLREWIRKDF